MYNVLVPSFASHFRNSSAIQLTGLQGGDIQNVSIPPQTYVGVTLNSPTTVSFRMHKSCKILPEPGSETSLLSNGNILERAVHQRARSVGAVRWKPILIVPEQGK
jgi:hypothetical protein